MELEFSQQIFEIPLNIKFHENWSRESRERQSERHQEADSRISQLANVP
jgi:hypothetical protein